jgi:hypothetical protein
MLKSVDLLFSCNYHIVDKYKMPEKYVYKILLKYQTCVYYVLIMDIEHVRWK